MNRENLDLLRTIARMDFDPIPITDALLIGELVNTGTMQRRLYSIGEMMRLCAYLITLQKADLVRPMQELGMDAIKARDQIRMQAEWLRTTANILDAAGARLTIAAAAWATSPDDPGSANDNGDGPSAA